MQYKKQVSCTINENKVATLQGFCLCGCTLHCTGYLHEHSISTKIPHSLNLTVTTYIRNPLGTEVA